MKVVFFIVRCFVPQNRIWFLNYLIIEKTDYSFDYRLYNDCKFIFTNQKIIMINENPLCFIHSAYHNPETDCGLSQLSS